MKKLSLILFLLILAFTNIQSAYAQSSGCGEAFPNFCGNLCYQNCPSSTPQFVCINDQAFCAPSGCNLQMCGGKGYCSNDACPNPLTFQCNNNVAQCVGPTCSSNPILAVQIPHSDPTIYIHNDDPAITNSVYVSASTLCAGPYDFQLWYWSNESGKWFKASDTGLITANNTTFDLEKGVTKYTVWVYVPNGNSSIGSSVYFYKMDKTASSTPFSTSANLNWSVRMLAVEDLQFPTFYLLYGKDPNLLKDRTVAAGEIGPIYASSKDFNSSTGENTWYNVSDYPNVHDFYPLNNLEPDTTYYWRIRTAHPNKTNSFFEGGSFKTLSTGSGHRRVFTTSTTYDGNLGGVAGADAKCLDRANTAKLCGSSDCPAGSWIAWISDRSGLNPLAKLSDVNTQYSLVDDKTLVTTSLEALTGGALQNPINMDELKNSGINRSIWTDTYDNGREAGGQDCSRWTSTVGSSMLSGFSGESQNGWSAYSPISLDCSSKLGLYCFEKTVHPEVLPTPTSQPAPSPVPLGNDYRRVFITSTRYNGNLGGLSGADAKCLDRANAAKLCGSTDCPADSWKAWLSDRTTSASTRLNHSTVPYGLIDGTKTVANDWTDLITQDQPTSNWIKNPISKDEFGNLILDDPPGNGSVWTNTERDGLSYVTGGRGACDNWTSAEGSPVLGYGGDNTRINLQWTYDFSQICSNSARLYCFEQSTTPIPTPTPTPSPVPPVVKAPCAITAASWNSPANPATEGTGVNLDVETSGDCANKQVQFEIREDDGILGADPVQTNPSAVDIVNGVATGQWTAEYQCDGLLCIADPPEYYFEANIVGESTKVQSANPELKVNKVVSPTPIEAAPTPSPTPTPTPTPSPSPTSTPGSTSSPTPAPRNPPCDGFGDVNLDGVVSQIDVDWISQHLSGTRTFTNDQKKRTDVSGDNNISSDDVAKIQGYLDGTVTNFVLCQPITISNISLINIQKNNATISWKTSYPGTHKIIYGTSRTALTQTVQPDQLYATTHTLTIPGLQPAKLYFYKVQSENGAGLVTSPLRVFRTRQ